MKITQGILYVEFSDLINLNISEKYLKHATTQQFPSWQSIKDPLDKRKRLIQYETLKSKYKKLIQKQYGDPYQYLLIQNQRDQLNKEELTKETLPHHISPLADDVKHFQINHSVSDNEAQQLARACAWLSFYLSVKTKDQAKSIGFESKEDLLQAILFHLNREKLKCLNIKNLRVLKRKISAFKSNGKDILISKKRGNNNAEKLTNIAKTILRRIYREHNAFPLTHVVYQYNLLAIQKNLSPISLSTGKAYLSQPAIQMICLKQRYGSDYYRNNLDIYMTRKKPTYPNDMWVMDGTPIELYYKDKKGLRRIYGFMIVDCYSWNIVGYSIGETETEQLVFQALKNACIKTSSLPLQLQFDNSSAIKSNDMMEWYKMVSIFITPAAVGNARAKIIEPLMAHFNKQILKYYDNHSGGNITAKSQDSKVNKDWIKAHPESMPNRSQTINQFKVAVEAWNNRAMSDGSSPAEKYKKESPRIRQLEFMDTINLFWKYRVDGKGNKKEIKYTSGGLTLTINREKHIYMVYDADGLPDKEFHLNYRGDKFQIKYDPEDMEMIFLYKNDRPIHMAQLIREAPMAIVDYKEGDGEYIQGFIKRRKDIAQTIQKTNDQDDELLQELELIDAEGYLKMPVPVDGKYKDLMNEAQERIKTDGVSIYNTQKEGGLA